MASVPAVFVTKGRQRLKQYSGYGNGTVYLRNGDEFELELFNPTQNKVLAKISMNGKSLGSGIVLRPAERVFLERYLDDARKFLFETYEVNGADPEVKQAIKLNGVIDVEFFDEQKPSNLIWNSSTITYTNYPVWTNNNPRPGIFFTNTGGTIGSSSPNKDEVNDNNTLKTRGAQTKGINREDFQCYSANIGEANLFSEPIAFADNFANAVPCSAKVEPLETGRVEKGGTSNQEFVYDNTSFNSWYSWKTQWNIIPESQRPLVAEDLSVYCSNCGAKRKKSTHKFCPNCGAKF
jgi:hypothetical protein